MDTETAEAIDSLRTGIRHVEMSLGAEMKTVDVKVDQLDVKNLKRV